MKCVRRGMTTSGGSSGFAQDRDRRRSAGADRFETDHAGAGLPGIADAPHKHQEDTRMNVSGNTTTDEATIRQMVENWARAVRAKNLEGIVADHSPDIVM